MSVYGCMYMMVLCLGVRYVTGTCQQIVAFRIRFYWYTNLCVYSIHVPENMGEGGEGGGTVST